MSFDYFVAVHRDAWPTADGVQRSLESLGYPLRLVEASAEPFEVKDFREGLPVVFEGRPIVLEADIEEATDVDNPESLFGYIAQCAVSNFKISNGDRFLTLTFRSDADQIRAGLYLAAALILSYGGYGFENQAETHGGESFARQLLAEAADAAAFERSDSQLPPDPNFAVPEPKPSIIGRVFGIFGPK